jgi:Fic family protein
MSYLKLEILPAGLLEAYKKNFDSFAEKHFELLEDSQLSIDNFSFYTSVSAVFSSKIEGENIELDSFIKHKKLGVKYLPDYTRKPDDLYEAYLLAQNNKLTPENIASAHAQITRHILQASQQGKFRSGNMFVITQDGRIEYVAATPDKVETEMQKLYTDLDVLLNTPLSFDEVFFFASLLHLIFVKVHPFGDGNGRTARLLEKWFLAQKLGNKAWFMQSERNYYEHHALYYQNIRRLGIEYEELNFAEALPFLQMLPESLKL